MPRSSQRKPARSSARNGEDQHGGDKRGYEQRFLGVEAVGDEQRAEEEIEADGRAEEFGEVGGDGGDLGGDPEADGGGSREVLAAVLRQGEAGDDAQLGGEVLDEHRHGVRPEQDPEQAVAKLRAAEDVGGEVAGVDVGDRGDEGGAEVGPHLGAAQVGEKTAPGRDCIGNRWSFASRARERFRLPGSFGSICIGERSGIHLLCRAPGKLGGGMAHHKKLGSPSN